MECIDAQKLAFRMLTSKLHPQQALLSADAFRSHASKRMKGVHFDLLEVSEQESLLYPVLCCRAPTSTHRVVERGPDDAITWETAAVDGEVAAGDDVVEIPMGFWFSGEFLQAIAEEGDILWPGQSEFVPWGEQVDSTTGMHTVWRYYHPYQTLMLRNVLDLIVQSVSVATELSAEALSRWADSVQAHAASARKLLSEGQAQHFRALALLLAVEDLYLPMVRRTVFHYGFAEPSQSWDKWQRAVDRANLLRSTGWSVEEVMEWRRNLATRAIVIDPNERFYMLLRELQHGHRQRLKGDALMAWDYYETAELLGLFLTDLTGERQPNVDDLWTRGDPKERLYGIAASDIDHARGNVLPGLTRVLGLDVRPRVLWLVEGKTEDEFVGRYCDEFGIDLDAYKVRRQHLAGIARARDPNLIALLEQAKEWESAVIVTIDRDDGADDLVRLLRSLGIGDRAMGVGDLAQDALLWGAFVWTTNFENDNFSTAQLLEAWLMTVPRTGSEAAPAESAAELRESFTVYAAEHEGLTPLEMIMGFAKSKHLYYDKPEVASRLPDVLRAQRLLTDGAPPIPVERLLGKVISLASRLRTARMRY